MNHVQLVCIIIKSTTISDDCVIAAFNSERGKKQVKRPVGWPRKRPLEDDGRPQVDKENVQMAPVDECNSEEPMNGLRDV